MSPASVRGPISTSAIPSGGEQTLARRAACAPGAPAPPTPPLARRAVRAAAPRPLRRCARCSRSRAGITFESLTTSRSPSPSRSRRSRTWRWSGAALPRSTSRRAASRGSIGTWAMRSVRQLVVEVGEAHGGAKATATRCGVVTRCATMTTHANRPGAVRRRRRDGPARLDARTAGRGPRSLLIQEIFGVGAYIRAVAERLADAGYVVGAPDVFWRFAPGWAADHDEAGLGASIEKVQQLDFPQAIADCVAALEHAGRRSTDVDGARRAGLLPRRHAGVRRRRRRRAVVLRQLLRLGRAGHARHARAGVTARRCSTSATPTRTSPTRASSRRRGDRRPRPGFVAQRRERRPRLRQPRGDDVLRRDAAKAAWAKTMAFLTEHARG